MASAPAMTCATSDGGMVARCSEIDTSTARPRRASSSSMSGVRSTMHTAGSAVSSAARDRGRDGARRRAGGNGSDGVDAREPAEVSLESAPRGVVARSPRTRGGSRRLAPGAAGEGICSVYYFSHLKVSTLA